MLGVENRIKQAKSSALRTVGNCGCHLRLNLFVKPALPQNSYI